MNVFNQIVYMIGAVTTVLSIVLCLVLFFSCKSRDSKGRRIELDNRTSEAPWSLGTWIAGVFVAGTGVALMYAPGDLVGYVQQGLNPAESITMVALLNGAPVWALYSVMGLWYMRHMDSKIGKLAAMLSTVLGMSISLWTGMNTVARFIGLDFPGFKFMLAAIKTALLEASGVKEKPLGKNAQNAALRRQFVLDYFKENALIHNADLCEGLGVSPATANRILRDLSEDGTLERVRDGKFWAYRLVGKV